MKKKILIMGAAGRDFHNFNTLYRDKKDVEVVCFTAAQIPDITNREYPAELAGKNYPEGIPIKSEENLEKIIKEEKIDEVILSYSDLNYIDVMRKSARVNAAGADFKLVTPDKTMLKSNVPVIAVTAIRTGAGKSQTSRRILEILEKEDIKTAVVRHPMPYGDLKKQKVQVFKEYSDLEKEKCTIEEREEYEPHIEKGATVYAGVDYQEILKKAEKENDVIIWDGGNNDTPFYKPDQWITVFDPHRPGHEIRYYPGELNAILCDTALINKVETSEEENIEQVKQNINKLNPKARVVEAASEVKVDKPSIIENKKVIVIEDGPTLTHGELKTGAGTIAAEKHSAKPIKPGKYTVGSIKETYEKYKLEKVIPAMGYSEKQIKELEETINKSNAEAAVIGTPINLKRILNINKPAARVTYELKEKTKPGLEKEIREIMKMVK